MRRLAPKKGSRSPWRGDTPRCERAGQTHPNMDTAHE
jgi:hypothetical protein